MITGIIIGKVIHVDASRHCVTIHVGDNCSEVEVMCHEESAVRQAAIFLYEGVKATISEDEVKVFKGRCAAKCHVSFESYSLENPK